MPSASMSAMKAGPAAPSTAPWSFQGKLRTYQLKVLRYPGTFAQLKAFSDLGLFDPEPVRVKGREVIPRELFNALFEPQVRVDDVKDVCIVRAHAKGKKNGLPTEAVVEVIDYYDESTGFTAMQRMTGWHISIVAAMIAKHNIPTGAIPLELAVPARAFVREAKKRGFKITERIAPAEPVVEEEFAVMG